MTKDIIKLSATFLGLDDVVYYLSNPTSELKSETKEKIDNLIIYLNYIYREITRECFPLMHEEVIASSDQSEIHFSNFEFKPLAINDVKDSFNNSNTFNIYPEFLKVGKPNTNYLIKYQYEPNKILSLNDKLTLPLGVEPFIICYGISSEYALSKLLYSEAEMWETKFKNSLETFKSIKGERRFFSRRLK